MSYFDLPPVLEQMLLVSNRISDLNFSVGAPPQVEMNGELNPVQPLGLERLTPYHTEIIALTLLRGHPDATAKLVRSGSCDMSYSLPSRTRFRVNIFQQRGTFSIVMRVIPNGVPTIASLKLPAQLTETAELRNGIVLITGPTGVGKSSTLAAILSQINQTKRHHVVTIEDPIEFLHAHNLSIINQREIGTDAQDFPSALRAALRQAPKVILIGEMRDFETTEIALEAAETGHLVLSSMHTIDAAKTIDRIIGLYPKNEEAVIRTRLSQTFRFIVSQRLIPRINADGTHGGRIAAVEILKSTPRTREYIKEGESNGKSLLDAMRDGELEGMQDFDSVIRKLIGQKIVSLEDGLTFATNPNNMLLALKGLSSGDDFTMPDAPPPSTVKPPHAASTSMLNMIE